MQTFASNWSKGLTGVDQVLFLDWGRLSDLLTEWNARLIGYDTSNPSSYLLENLACCSTNGYTRSIAQICSEKVPVGEDSCVGNSLTVDGLHPCMETLGGRLSAGVSCLIGCVYAKDQSSLQHNDTLKSCEKQCNDQFMTLEPVDHDSS
jgi:hypothetical protein